MAVGGAVGALSGLAGYGFSVAGVAMGINGIVPGMLYGGVTGGITGAVAGGTTAALLGTDIGKGMKMGLITGAITGAIWGGIDGGMRANKSGTNMWWGSKIGYNRNKWSLAWWDKPNRAWSPIEYRLGTTSGSCFPTTMAGISKSYGHPEQNESFWIKQYELVTGKTFTNGTVINDADQLCEIVQSVGYEMNQIEVNEILSTMSGGDKVLVDAVLWKLNPDGSYNSHAMSVRSISEVPDVSFKMNLCNPETGFGFRIFNKNEIVKYGLQFFRIR
jgi:hypothetical protein